MPSVIAVLSSFHLIGLIILYGIFDFSVTEMNIISAWKELLILESFLIALYLLWKYRELNTFIPTIIDKLILLYLGINVGYIFISFGLGYSINSVQGVMNGFRIQTMLVFSYFAARFLSVVRPDDFLKFAKFIVMLSTIYSSVAIIEVVVNPIPLLNSIGYKDYLMQVAGEQESAFVPEDVMGTYFSHFDTPSGEVRIRRAGSLFLGPITYGQVLVVTLPIALLLVLSQQISIYVLVIQLSGLLATVSRGPILAAFIACICIIFFNKTLSKSIQRKSLFVLITVFLILAYKAAPLIKATISLDDSSAATRLITYTRSIDLVIDTPYGLGLAASDVKFAGENYEGGAESEFLEIVSRIGWLGLAIYIVIHFTIIASSYRCTKSDNMQLAFISIVVLSVTIGLFSQQFLNRIWRHPYLPFIYGWILGVWATYYSEFKYKKMSNKKTEDDSVQV